MKLGVDVDGVLRDFVSAYHEVYVSLYGGEGITPINHWDLKKAYPNFKTNHIDFFSNHLFLKSKPYPGALDFMERLNNTPHDIYIVTNQRKNKEHYTLRWLEKYAVKYDGIVFSSDKNVFNGDFLLDDGNHNLDNFHGTPVLFKRPWNEVRDNYLSVSSYDDFIDILKEV